MKFRPYLLLICTWMTLSACSQPDPTVEELVLMGIFSNFVAAEVYDTQCENGKITKAPPTKDLNIYWYGNQQTFVAMIAAPMKRRHPKDTVEESIARLLKTKEKMAAKLKSILNEKGCASVEARHMHEALQMFTKIPPWGLANMVADQVKKQGGTMTELTDAENRISH